MLSSIQQGVQNFHVCHELFNKYPLSSTSASNVLHLWSLGHKTAVFLNGGNAAGLRDVYAQISEFGDSLDLPYAKFHEDEDSLDNSMTACGIVLPTSIVDIAQRLREGTGVFYQDIEPCPEIALATFINQFQLAR